MNPTLDPVISQKLNDFRSRRRNLILLRGLCSGVLSFLGVFVMIALIDYLTQARMQNELRSWLSIIGYLFVFGMVWQTCIQPLLQLPSSRKLARLLEKSSPELKEDLLSAVELGLTNQNIDDSEIFRKLVQKQASLKVSKIDIKSILPIGRLKNWLVGTLALIMVTFALLQIPEFGGDLKLLMQRAMIPGANLPPVTNFEVSILIPDENVTRTPSNEPLRFVASVKAKKEGVRFDEISLETKTLEESSTVNLVKREPGKFFVDYNVGNRKFEYRVLIDEAPQTEWRKMDVGSRPYVKNYRKSFSFPAYSELEPIEVVDNHGDLEAWEGTEIELSMHLSQPVKSGSLEFQWVEKKEELRQLSPSGDGMLLSTKMKLTHPGTFRVRNLVDRTLGWEGRPSSIFEISVKPDLAPSIQWVDLQERSLLVAPNDLLTFMALAQDDLGLSRVEYQLKKNRGRWESFAIPGLLDPRRQKSAAIEFNLDLLQHKLKSGTQAFLKLKAFDLKGLEAETEILQLSIVSRDFDLSEIRILEKKALIIDNFDSIKKELSQMQKSLQQTFKEFQMDKSSKETVLEKANQEEVALLITSRKAYEDTLQVLFSMPRGSDSYEISMLAKGIGQVVSSSAKTWEDSIRGIRDESEEHRVRSKSNELNKITSNRKGIIGNLRNVAQDLLNQHAEMVAVAYLNSLQRRQKELLEDIEGRKPLPFLLRRQEVALNQWDPIAEALSHSLEWQKSSKLRKLQSEQLKFLQKLENENLDRESLKKQIGFWNQILQGIFREIHQKLASRSRESFRHKPEELYWNLNRNHFFWDDLKREWERTLGSNTADSPPISDLLGKLDILISETMMKSEVEQTRTDQNSLFVKDAGQTGRALIKIQREIRDAETVTETEKEETLSSLSEKSKRLGESFQLLLLQHHLIGSANQIIFFMRKENGNFSNWKGSECARQWGRVETIWKPALEMLIRLQISKEAVELMRKLPNQDYRKKVVNEMEARIKSNQHDAQSTLMNADLVFQDLQKIISMLKEEALAARAYINQVAPTLSELARELAKETEEQKKKIEETQKDEETPLPEKLEKMANLNNLQQEIGNSIENFAQALRQEANIQNILDKEGREIARDSDDAASLVEEREREIEENLTEASQARNQEELDLAKDETIDEQENLIEELNLIADHFENLLNPDSVVKTREELRKLEEQLENAEEIEEQYAQAERLADLAQLAPEELLEELEEELVRNENMQRELSDLAQDVVEASKEQLEEALAKEEKLIDELEKEDDELQKQKDAISRQLEEIAKETQNLAKQKIESIEQQAEKAQAETLSQKAEVLKDILEEKAEETLDATQNKPNTQELKDAAIALADSLENTSEDLQEIANDLAKQYELDPENALQNAKKAESLAKQNQAEAKTLQEKANELQNQAQQAQQEFLKNQIEENKVINDVIDAKQDMEKAEALLSQSSNDPTLKENLEKASDQFAKQKEAFQEVQELALLAEKQANQLMQEANLALQDAENAKQEADEAKQEADEANALAEALADPNLNGAVNEASKQGNELAFQAAEEAKGLKKRAEELADALDQLTEKAEGNAELLAEAKQTQEEIAEDLFETSQELARAARHEERLENKEIGESLQDLADAIEETALIETAKAAQSLDNQALANALEDLAVAAEELSDELSSGDPQGDESFAEQLNSQAKETIDLIDGNPTFAELKDQAEQFAEQANLAEEGLSKLAEKLASDAKSAQEMADLSRESAEQAKTEMQAAQSMANQAAQEFQNLLQASAKASQALENGTGTQEEANSLAEETLSSSANAEQLSRAAESAQENFEEAQLKAKTDFNLANEANAEARQAAQQADEANDLAKTANELLDQVSESLPIEELANAELPGAGIALNDLADSLKNQLESLDNLNSGDTQNMSSPTNTAETSATSDGESSKSMPENYTSIEDPFDSGSPFSDPEVSEALAQALDALDQALFASQNPFSEATESFSGLPSSNSEPGQSNSPDSPTSGGTEEFEAFPGESDQQIPGDGPGTGASPLASTNSANQAIAQALQSLQLATQAHAQSMSQQRLLMGEGKGNQLTSNDNDYQSTPVTEIGEIPIFENSQDQEEWGKLPPKLAKDLMEAKRERVSENYRSQVHAYFQAMSSKARTTKK